MAHLEPSEAPVPGVCFLEHTADVGLEATAPEPRELFRRAALGMIHLLAERLPQPVGDRTTTLGASDLPALLRNLLRQLLHWHEDGFTVAELKVTSLARDSQGRWTLSARGRGGPQDEPPLREIKGVTLHGLVAEQRDGSWYGRVIFDV